MSFIEFRRIRFMPPVLILLFTVNFCASKQIKDKKSLDNAREEALKGNKPNLENYEKNLESAEKENNPELQKMIINDLATIPGKESSTLLMIQAGSESPEIRSAAVKALFEQTKLENNQGITKEEIFNTIKNNKENHNELTSGEIQVLGELGNDESPDLLIQSLYAGENSDNEILHALGLILEKNLRKLKWISIAKNPVLDKKEIVESIVQKIEKAFMDYIKSDVSASQKESALFELYNAYVPDSREKFLKMYHSPDYDEKIKLMILKILGYRENPENDSLVKSLKAEYLGTENEKEKTRILNRIGTLVPNEFKKIKAELEKEMNNTLRRRELRLLAGKDQITMLKSILKRHDVSSLLVDKLQETTEKLAADNTIPMPAEAVILFSSLREIFPDKNYFELKKIGERGLRIPGLFSTILGSVDSNFASYDMKILTIQSVWKISEGDAGKIYKAWQIEKKFLREILR